MTLLQWTHCKPITAAREVDRGDPDFFERFDSPAKA